jgi:hypothetical protein
MRGARRGRSGQVRSGQVRSGQVRSGTKIRLTIIGWPRPPGHERARSRHLAVRGRARCDIERRVVVEERSRLQHEASPVGRHDRPVLGPRNVVTAHGVPEHDIGVLDRAISFRPSGEPGTAGVLVRVIARREPLIGPVKGDPQVLGRECGPPGHRGGGMAESQDVTAGDELLGRLMPHFGPVARVDQPASTGRAAGRSRAAPTSTRKSSTGATTPAGPPS